MDIIKLTDIEITKVLASLYTAAQAMKPGIEGRSDSTTDISKARAAVGRAKVRLEDLSVSLSKPTPTENHSESTLPLVYGALLSAGIYGQAAVDAVFQMQKAGVLFRERS